MTITAVDNRAEVLAAAVALRPQLATTTGLELTVADGRGLPFADDAFDVAHASLVLHHLEPNDAPALLREMARVAGRGVVLNDLSRGQLALAGAWILSHLFTANRYTRHDAPMSVRRAYTLDEALALLIMAGLRPVYSATGLAGHRWVVAAVRA
jgi:ubiquinone/menaquinone biosynthesis C-methylase UbiE